MAMIALNNAHLLPTPEVITPSVSLEDYNKLKSKYEKKQKENKILKENLDIIMSSYEIINQSKKSVEAIFEAIKNLINSNKTFTNKSKEEFSTTFSHCEYLGTADMKTSARSTCICSSNSINVKDYHNPNLLKKIEDIENSYNEMQKSFNLLASKYKIIKEENEKVEQCNISLIDQIAGLSGDYEKICNQLNEANFNIERFKEIDKCLVDSAISSLFLNTNEKKVLDANAKANKTNIDSDVRSNVISVNSAIVNNANYILCEPVPSFIKFINKFTK